MTIVTGLMLAALSAPCTPVEKETITGADFAVADTQFAVLPASKMIGYSPSPGRSRIFGIPELKAFTEANGVPITPTKDLCFTWPVIAIDERSALESMREAYPSAAIEIIEVSRFPAPAGRISFPRSGLQRASAPIMTWRGYITYGSGRRFDIWARVKVTVRTERVITNEMVRAGTVIREQQLKLDTYQGPPLPETYASSFEEVVGRVARTTILAQKPIRSSDIDTAPDIVRGDVVNVQVVNGAARVSMDALATNTARRGEMVQLTNKTSGKTFRAKVSGSGQAVIVLGTGSQ